MISRRAMIGLIVSPLVATLTFWGVSFIVSIINHPEPNTTPFSISQRIMGFLVTCVLSSFIAYGVAVVMGIPLFLLLIRRNLMSLSHFVILGVILAVGPMILELFLYQRWFVYDLVRFVLSGIAGSVTFWLLAIKNNEQSG